MKYLNFDIKQIRCKKKCNVQWILPFFLYQVNIYKKKMETQSVHILNQDKPHSAGTMTYSSEQPKYSFLLK